jgi:DNA-binding PadR family transcriptional regulator
MGDNAVRLPSISTFESLIIDLLHGEERYGLELVEASNRQLKRGTIYVTLSRMETKGFIASRQEAPHPSAIGLPRRMYRVTPYGLKVHKAYKLLREALALKPAEAH